MGEPLESSRFSSGNGEGRTASSLVVFLENVPTAASEDERNEVLTGIGRLVGCQHDDQSYIVTHCRFILFYAVRRVTYCGVAVLCFYSLVLIFFRAVVTRATSPGCEAPGGRSQGMRGQWYSN